MNLQDSRDIEKREIQADGSAPPALHNEVVPLISVVMAVRNEAAMIDEQLAALARQTMSEPWELVVVDNGSSDDTPQRVLAWQTRIPWLRLLPGPSEPSRSKPLNVGAAAARADRLAFCDADDIVSDGWVEAMCRTLADHPHVTGPIELARLSPWGDQVANWLVQPPRSPFLPYAMGCNAGWRRAVFSSLGGFDERIPSGQDKDLSWRAQLSGHELWFEPAALVHRRQRTTLRTALRQYIRYGRSTRRLTRRFQPYGAVPRSLRRAAAEWADVVLHIPWVLRPGGRVRFAKRVGFQIGRALPLSRSTRRSLALRLESPRLAAPTPDEPRISVILACRNAAATIDEQLAALARQTMSEPWELVVVDNGSSDDTPQRVLAWQARIPWLRLVPGPSEPSRSKPLNVGAAAARADRLGFCDADDIVSDGWVEAMCRALADHAHVTGPLELAELNRSEPVRSDRAGRSLAELPRYYEFLPSALGCNAGWRRDVFCSLGGFDERMPSGQDTDLSWRAQLAGHELWFEPAALVHRRQRTTMLAAARQHFRYGRTGARLVARFRTSGMSRAESLRPLGNWLRVAMSVPWLLRCTHRIRWAELAGHALGRSLPIPRTERSLLRLSPGWATAMPSGSPARAN